MMTAMIAAVGNKARMDRGLAVVCLSVLLWRGLVRETGVVDLF